MLNACTNSRLSIAGLLLVMSGCLVLPFALTGQTVPAPASAQSLSSAQYGLAASAPLPAAVQAQLDKLAGELKAARAAGDAKAEARTLNEIGEAYFYTSEYLAGIENYGLALTAAQAANDSEQQATALNGLANNYLAQGQDRKALGIFQQALDLSAQSGDERGQATALNGIGWVDNDLGKNKEALELHLRALLLARKVGDADLEATVLRRIGNVYIATGENQKALDSQFEALPICVKAGNRRCEGRTLGNIGVIYSLLGEKQKAIEYSNRAVRILYEVGDRTPEAINLNNLGEQYSELGDQVKAVQYFAQALPIQRQIGDRKAQSITLNNIGSAFEIVGENEQALSYFNKALAMEREVGLRGPEAMTLGNMAGVDSNASNLHDAIQRSSEVLDIYREVGDRSGESLTLSNLGYLLDRSGDHEKALDSYNQALALAKAVGNPIREAVVLGGLMLNQKETHPALAVFYGKRAVNLLQQVRGNIQGLDKSLQKSFLSSNAGYYRYLADLLIAQGRLPEAEQVLNLEKQQEYSDYVRGAAADTLSPLAMTPAEKQAEEDYEKSTAQLVSLGEQWAQLRKNTARTAEQEKQFQEIKDQLAQASKGLNVFYSRLYELFGKTNSANNQVRDVKGPVSELKQIIAKMPHTVVLYTLVGTDRTSIIVIAGSADVPPVVREYAISEVELNKKVAAFQQVLRQPRQDPRPLAQELYKILIGPVKADLDQAKAETLVWSLDGVLRYVPMAALYDGKHYVVENYNTVTITPASIAHLAQSPDVSNMSTVAMGISQKYEEGLPALPAVVDELDDVVNDAKVQGANGALAGTILLNGQFTEKAMENQLGAEHKPTVVHIASHFVYSPGDASKSYLLLAGKDQGGEPFHLTVEDFHDNPSLSLTETALLTLSACDTGMSGNASDGKEVDGLGMTAEYKGAKAVISSLWSVNDASTGQLMGDFYKRWADGAGKVEKVEALRQAQLDLLLGKAKVHGEGSDRGFDADKSEVPAPAGYAHPYYWAPFVLMGNWR